MLRRVKMTFKTDICYMYALFPLAIKGGKVWGDRRRTRGAVDAKSANQARARCTLYEARENNLASYLTEKCLFVGTQTISGPM